MTFSLLLITIGIFVIFMTFLVYWSAAHWSFKAVALSIFLSISLGSVSIYYKALGSPLQTNPGKEFMYIHHTITSDSTIIIWSYEDKIGYRLYEIPYDRKTAKKLQKAQKQASEGRPFKGKFKKQASGNTLEMAPGVLEENGRNVVKD